MWQVTVNNPVLQKLNLTPQSQEVQKSFSIFNFKMLKGKSKNEYRITTKMYHVIVEMTVIVIIYCEAIT